MVKVTDVLVDVVFDTRRVLRLPTTLAMVLRDMCMEWGVGSETAMAFATMVWCVTRLDTQSGHRFAQWAIRSSSGVAEVVVMPKGGRIIDDGAVVYDREWTPRPTGRVEDLVSIGFAMDNSMERLGRIMSRDGVDTLSHMATEAESAAVAPEQDDAVGADADGSVRVKMTIATSAWVYSREQRLWKRRVGQRLADETAARLECEKLAKLVELTHGQQTAERRRAAVEGVQRTALGRMDEVPAMLNQDRMVVGDVDGTCRGSRKTVLTAPSVPMLIWQARTRAEVMSQRASWIGLRLSWRGTPLRRHWRGIRRALLLQMVRGTVSV
jgi:hypothetical protein